MHYLNGGIKKMLMKMLPDIQDSGLDFPILKNTNEILDKKTKRKQVGSNVIDKAILEYNLEIDDIFTNEIDTKIPYIDQIKYNNQSKYDEKNICRVSLKNSVITKLQNWSKTKYSNNYSSNKELELILDEYFEKLDSELNNETTSSSSFIQYACATPRLDVLKRLRDISEELKCNPTNIFSKKDLLFIIEKQEGIRDNRVIKKYHECLLMYSIKKNQANIQHDEYNMSGFRSDVLYLIKNREGKNVRV